MNSCVSCSPGLLLVMMQQLGQNFPQWFHWVLKPPAPSVLHGNEPYVHTARKRKSWDPNTLRKTQTWICTLWLISASVFDPTKILDLNFRGRFFSIQLGWTHTYMYVCRHLHASCTAFVFSLFHHLLKFLPIFCLWVLDVTNIIKFPPPWCEWRVNYSVLVPTEF